ncbi:MAG: hypothetical protein WCA24_04245 [Thiomonas sp.]
MAQIGIGANNPAFGLTGDGSGRAWISEDPRIRDLGQMHPHRWLGVAKHAVRKIDLAEPIDPPEIRASRKRADQEIMCMSD